MRRYSEDDYSMRARMRSTCSSEDTETNWMERIGGIGQGCVLIPTAVW